LERSVAEWASEFLERLDTIEDQQHSFLTEAAGEEFDFGEDRRRWRDVDFKRREDVSKEGSDEVGRFSEVPWL